MERSFSRLLPLFSRNQPIRGIPMGDAAPLFIPSSGQARLI
ncbi:hypothetical protein CGRA01v4_06166 [Colletotrichum graminicola]|nr:hypothetical protein CGRA01v4_06166 [Colletotrichum graminicola]